MTHFETQKAVVDFVKQATGLDKPIKEVVLRVNSIELTTLQVTFYPGELDFTTLKTLTWKLEDSETLEVGQ